MVKTQKKQYYYPNNMGRIILLAIEDVIGRNGLDAILNLAGLSDVIENLPPVNFERQFSFDRLSRIMSSIESYFGPRAGRGLALRSGRACFKYGLREYGPMLEASDKAFRLLPLTTKLDKGSEIFAGVFNRFTDQQVRLEIIDDIILWQIERCPICWQRTTEAPACHLAVGILQEALYWMSGGKCFQIEETACIAQGEPACTIEINKTPLS
ncbi:MAG: 4-vinyl reductase [Chloroflexi bacterium]|nr:4-vinyl reductase [Chloroflexota bacterium]